MKMLCGAPKIHTVDYAKYLNSMRICYSFGTVVDLVVENCGTSSLVKSLKCTPRAGIVSQVSYLEKRDPQHLE